MTEYEQLHLIDSNILVYAYNKSAGKKHSKAKEVMKRSWIKKNSVLSIQNLAEFHSVITKKAKKPVSLDKSKQIILDLIDGFEILRYNENTIINAINNQAIHKIPFWDALIVSTME